MMGDRIRREAEFFNSPHVNLLHFLNRGGGRFNRWLIHEVLKSWDKQLAFLDPSWIRNKVVFEACCGNPRVLYYFHLLGARSLIGCDVAKEFVSEGLGISETYVFDRKITCLMPPFQMILGDVENLPLQRSSVDTVCCFQALHHVDLHRFGRECERILVPKGHVYISDPVGTHFLRPIGDWVGRKFGPMSGDEKAYDPEQVIRVFEDAGFQLVKFLSLNPFSEIYFQITEILTSISSDLSFYLKVPMGLMNRVEPLLEKTVLKVYPSLGWRFVLAMEKRT